MDITKASLKNPAAVAAAVALVVLFGIVAMLDLPLQLFPDIERPQMSIQTDWRAASPQEMESEIVEPIEAVMQGLPGLEEIESATSNAGNSWINLTFAVGSDMDAMLVEVLWRMNRLQPLPRDADAAGGAGRRRQRQQLADLLLRAEAARHARRRSLDYRQMIEDRIVPRLSSVDGVAGVEINGGAPEELTITLNLERAAAMGIQIPEVAAVAARATDVSGGVVEAGRRQYVLRFAGRYSPQAMRELILTWRDGRPIRLGDVAEVEVKRPEQRFFAYQNGNPAIGLRILRESGANVLDTLDEVKNVVAEVREQELLPQGLDIKQSFDASVFINRAIGLLSGSLFAGVLLAIGCLWWFLRDVRATALIACAIPISLLATFIVLQLTGPQPQRDLAGGPRVRGRHGDGRGSRRRREHRAAARGRHAGAAGGARRHAPGRRRAVCVDADHGRGVRAGDLHGGRRRPAVRGPGADDLDRGRHLAADRVHRAAGRGRQLAARGQAERRAASLLVARQRLGAAHYGHAQAAMAVGRRAGARAGAAGGVLMPKIDYLPPVKRAAVDAIFNFPPGMSPERVNREIAPALLQRMRPYMDGEKAPQLSNWYLNLWDGGGTIGARVVDPGDIGELERIIRDEVVVGFPDTRAFASEGELFGSFGGSARAIAIHLQHADGDALSRAAETGRKLLSENASPAPTCRPGPTPTPARRNCASNLMTAAWPKSAGDGPTSAPSCARSATASGSANTSTATAAWRSSCAAIATTTSNASKPRRWRRRKAACSASANWRRWIRC